MLKYKVCIYLILLHSLDFLSFLSAQVQMPDREPIQLRTPSSVPEKYSLVQAVMCEGIEDFSPQNHAIVFSVTIGKVFCYTYFDPVPQKTYIFHNWFHRDEMITTRKLFLQPPRWSSYSTIQLREADKGPWRVEITNAEGAVLRILRFSIVD